MAVDSNQIKSVSRLGIVELSGGARITGNLFELVRITTTKN